MVVLTADRSLQTADRPTSARGRPGERLDTIRPCDPDAAALAIRHALLTAATCATCAGPLDGLRFPVSGEAQFRAVGGAMPHWSHIGDTIPPSFPVQEIGTGAVLRSAWSLLTAHAREAV